MASAFHGHRHDAAVTYLRSELTVLDPAWQAELRQRPQWRSFRAAHGTWWAEFNTANAMPHRAFGEPITTSGPDPVTRATSFLQQELAMYALPMNELVVSGVYPALKHTYVHFTQVHNGLRVLTGKVMVKLDTQGRVIAFGLDVYSSIGISLDPAQDEAAAIASASSGLTGIEGVTISAALMVLPVPVHHGVEHRLVREIEVRTTEEGLPARWNCWVDANTGELLYRQDRVLRHAPPAAAGAEVNVSGNVFEQNPYIPATLQPMANMRVVVNGISQYLDQQGYANTGVGGPVNATFYLDGLWSNVRTNGTTPSFPATLQEGPNNISFDAEANSRERSAFFHVNIVHDHAKAWLPAFDGMDFPLTTNVDVAGSCNAFYDGGSINFYAEGGDCQSYAQVGEVVYHEYGHGINDRFYSDLGANFQNGAMNEGYADVWGFTITEDPILADGSSLTDPDSYIRRYDQDPKVYPIDIVGEVHGDGEIIAGAWWDTYILLGSDINAMMTLFAEAYPGLQADTPNGNEGVAFRDVLLDVLQADDDDGDLTNGTPNASAIVEAFAIHGITLLSSAELLHDAVENAPAAAAIELDAQLVLDLDFLSYVDEVRLFYRINNDPNWTMVPMMDMGGNDYHATIPGQPVGTVIAYYMGLADNFQQISGVLPIGAAQPDPNLPNFILVGYTLEATEDGDNFSELGNWQTGLPADNAVTGQWTYAFPVGSFSTPGDPATVVQPYFQHTQNGEFCYVTANANGEQAPIGDDDVDGGTTTFQSAVLDLTAYDNPTFSYWRWYTNNAGANPNADWWQVAISNDGTTWVPVENTTTTDRSWRRMAFRVQDYVTPNATVQIRFNASDSIRIGQDLDGGSLIEAAVDDIQLWDEMEENSIAENEQDLGLRVYPDPAMDMLNVRVDLDAVRTVEVRVLDLAGRTVDRPSTANTIGQERMTVDLSAYSAGSYILQVITDRGRDERRFSVVR